MSTTRLAAIANTLRPAEMRVAETLRNSPGEVVELTAQELADRVGVARTSVIRTPQALGYNGFSHLRVELTRHVHAQKVGSNAILPAQATELDSMRETILRALAVASSSLDLLHPEDVDAAIDALATARRVLCVANGLSTPLALDFALRLTALGATVGAPLDAFSQQLTAGQLDSGEVLVVVSGSGVNEVSVRAAQAARDGGGTVLAFTAFAKSPLATVADIVLVAASAGWSFQEEIETTSRLGLGLLLNALVGRVATRGGKTSRNAQQRALSIVADNLTDGVDVVKHPQTSRSRLRIRRALPVSDSRADLPNSSTGGAVPQHGSTQ
ncbi:MurR/RpiR family transcriptional regulator [Microbacterium sp. 22215]|uniref:MurR/RpiR family transcriptional regulator n=1 Tax=Microbacterium sp. 22215 TaxID=3453893 RepID=UPI003F84763E